jgi:hypothetical protein
MGFEFKPNLETNDIFENENELFLKGFDRVLVSNVNLIHIQTKGYAFYSHYKSKAIHQYKDKCMMA